MNKFYLLSIALMLTLCACGDSSKGKETQKSTTMAEVSDLYDSSKGKETQKSTTMGEASDLYDSYKEACRNLDFAWAHNYLDNNWSAEAEEDIFKKEVIYLLNSRDEKAALRTIFLLAEIKIEGNDHADGYFDFYECKKVEPYRSSTNHFNKLCDFLMDLAIQVNNKELAQRTLKMYKGVLYYERICDNPNSAHNRHLNSGNCYIGHNYCAKEAAEKKYKAAFK